MKSEEDFGYFRTYADISIHEDMIADDVRTNTYRKAILKNYKHFYGKVVADIGAGTGILSVFCVQAGAKKVFAVEASDMAEQIKLVAKDNNMEGRIQVVKGKVEDVDLEEKVDIIISEWMGYFLLYESMCQSVLLARDKWLKKDGLMFPSSASLYLALLSDTDYINQRLEFWDDVEDKYKVKMKSMIPYAKRCINNKIKVDCVPQECIYSHATCICQLDMKTASKEQIENVQSDFSLQSFGQTEINGLASWFTVGFPQDITLSTAPYTSETHWQQCIMYLDQVIPVTQDTVVTGTIKISPSSTFHRFLDIRLQYGTTDGDRHKQQFIMDDFIS